MTDRKRLRDDVHALVQLGSPFAIVRLGDIRDKHAR